MDGSTRVPPSGDGRAGRPRWAGWKLLAVGCVLLAAPTAVAPGSRTAEAAYLAGMVWASAAVFHGARGLPARLRRPWYLLGGVVLSWLLGDVVHAALELAGASAGGVGAPDVVWLASYPLQVAALTALIKGRELSGTVRRDLQLDVLVVSCAAAVGAWHLLIAPEVDASPSLAQSVLAVLAPLGDVAVCALALALVLAPGPVGPAGTLLVCCLGATLPLDCLYRVLPAVLPSADPARLDAAALVVTGLLGAAALHPRRVQLAEPAVDDADWHLKVWRVGALGVALVAVNVSMVFTRTAGLRALPDLVAASLVSVIAVMRFYRTARAQQEATDALRALVDHDQLTGAANRVLLHRRLGTFVTAGPGLLIYIDLDGFKAVNDSHGHHVGDALLRVVAGRLTALVRKADTVARVGGDEFVVLLQGSSWQDAPAIAHRVLADLRAPVVLDGRTATVGASIGVVVFDPAVGVPPAADRPVTTAGQIESVAEEVLQRADSAMYEAKRRGGGINIVQYSLRSS